MVGQLRQIGQDPALVAQTIAAVRADAESRLPELEVERRRLDRRHGELRTERRNLLDAIAAGTPGARSIQERLAAVDGDAEQVAERLAEVPVNVRAITEGHIDEADLRQALAVFDPVWDELFPREQARTLALLLERITVHVRNEEVALTFRPGGVRALNRRRTG